MHTVQMYKMLGSDYIMETYNETEANMKEANFAEPCEACRYWDECKGHFVKTLSGLMVDHKFKIARDGEDKND